MTRNRKQSRPRRVVQSVPAASGAPEPDGSTPEPEGSTPDEEQREPDRPEVPPDPRECLLALPGILSNRIPNEPSLDKLKKFLQDNQPCDSQQVK